MLIPEKISEKYNSMLTDGEALRVQCRLNAKDTALWSNNEQIQALILMRLGWLDSIDLMLSNVERIELFTQSIWDKGFRHCVLLGMGGSSLAPELFSKLFEDCSSDIKLSLNVLDNTSPDAISVLVSKLNLSNTLLIVSSKSGATIESDSLFRYFYHLIQQTGAKNPGDYFVAITDPQTELAKLAIERSFLDCFINPADIGGRFSVLSFFGLVPAALVGVDVFELLQSAKAERLEVENTFEVAAATKLGLMLGLAANCGLDKMVLSLNHYFEPFAAWLEQLVAESTGKLSKGITPIIEFCEDQTDTKNNIELSLVNHFGERQSLNYVQTMNHQQLGSEFFKWEWATAVAGSIMNINPFDEPNVGENKQVTLDVLASEADCNKLLLTENGQSLVYSNQQSDDSKLLEWLKISLAESVNGDYFAILVYCSDARPVENSVEVFRKILKTNAKMMSTFGIGPRYLHSTGQIHKGGLNNGIFLLITTDFESIVDIPGKDYDFANLNNAQATGDLSVLKACDRRIFHVHLPNTHESTLTHFSNLLNLAFQ